MGLQRSEAEHQDMESLPENIYDKNELKIEASDLPIYPINELTVEQMTNNVEEQNEEDAYDQWMMRYPSALKKFDRMMSMMQEKTIVVFLDYDGTLSHIVDDPDRAFMSDAMRSALSKVAQYFQTCIISGRRRDKVKEYVQLDNIYYVGSHGMDILAPVKRSEVGMDNFHGKSINEKGNEVIVFQPAQGFIPIIEQIFEELKEKTKNIPGVLIENNKFCVSVHFRRVDEEDWSVLEEKVTTIIEEYPSLRLTRGRKVVEIRPSIEWDKGRALEYLLDTIGLGSCGNALPLYIGDDRTDEDAFEVLQRRGRGYAILVSSIPKETKASYSLRDPSEVMSFLLRLSRWKRTSSKC